MSEGIGFARRNLIERIIEQNFDSEKSNFNRNELLFVIQELLDEEGKKYFEGRTTKKGYAMFRQLVELLLYRNIANYDSMILITSEKGCLTGDSLLEMPRDLKKYPKGVPLKKLVGKGPQYVYSFNIKTKKLELKLSDGVEFVKTDDVYELELINGMKVKATGDHPVLLTDGSYCELNKLTKKHKLELLVGNGQIKSIKYLGKQKVYDVVNVRDNHNFIVNGFIVSNTGKSSAAMMIARQWCKLIGIKFSPAKHIAYNNADLMNKIDNLRKFEPIICLPGNTYIRIKIKNKEYNECIKKLVGRNDFEVLTYNIKKDIFEWKKPEKVILTKKEKIDTIELDNGIKIQATSNHLFLTKNGIYKRVDELTTEDELILYSKKCICCNKEYYSPFQYSKTCSKKCCNINAKKLGKIYQKNHKPEARLRSRNKYKNNMTDMNYRISHNLFTRMLGAFLNKKIKYCMPIKKLLGCTIPQLMLHLEKQFNKNMSWNNYGTYWSIDHIKPLGSFDLTKKEEQVKAFNYKNIQPLECKENFKKISVGKRTCNYCNKEFITNNGMNKYCSFKCKKVAGLKRKEIREKENPELYAKNKQKYKLTRASKIRCKK